MVKNPSSKAGDAGSIPGPGTKSTHAPGQLSPSATNYRAHAPWSPRATTREEKKTHTPQLERSPRTTVKDPACHYEDPTYHNSDPTQPKKKKTFYHGRGFHGAGLGGFLEPYLPDFFT